MYLSGFADEAADGIDGQIRVTRELGWKNIECRNIDGTNLTMVDDPTFETVCGKLSDAGISVNCFGSGVANWSQKLDQSPQPSIDELKRAIPRMHKLGTTLIRVMSFACGDDDSINAPRVAEEVIRRMKTLVDIAEDGGVVLVHENCNSWGGRSLEHTLRLVEAMNSPAFKLVFDTGNPVFEKDVRGKPPYPYQDALEFYNHVKEHIVHVHIKDGRMVDGKIAFMFPGEGDGHVREICRDLCSSGYDGGYTIEPHMTSMPHDKHASSPEQARRENYIEYGRRMEGILREAGHAL